MLLVASHIATFGAIRLPVSTSRRMPTYSRREQLSSLAAFGLAAAVAPASAYDIVPTAEIDRQLAALLRAEADAASSGSQMAATRDPQRTLFQQARAALGHLRPHANRKRPAHHRPFSSSSARSCGHGGHRTSRLCVPGLSSWLLQECRRLVPHASERAVALRGGAVKAALGAR